MPPHNPTSCPRCRWAAARGGYQWHEDSFYAQGGYWWKITGLEPMRKVYSFCASLDAVAGLMKEMNESATKRAIGGLWRLVWVSMSKQWHYFCSGSRIRLYVSLEDLPGACVIEAAKERCEKVRSADKQSVAEYLDYGDCACEILPRALTVLEEAREELDKWRELVLRGGDWADDEFAAKYAALLGKAQLALAAEENG